MGKGSVADTDATANVKSEAAAIAWCLEIHKWPNTPQSEPNSVGITV